MTSNATPFSSMSRHPDLNRRPTDYEAATVPSKLGSLLLEQVGTNHKKSGAFTNGSRWAVALSPLLALALSCVRVSP